VLAPASATNFTAEALSCGRLRAVHDIMTPSSVWVHCGLFLFCKVVPSARVTHAHHLCFVPRSSLTPCVHRHSTGNLAVEPPKPKRRRRAVSRTSEDTSSGEAHVADGSSDAEAEPGVAWPSQAKRRCAQGLPEATVRRHGSGHASAAAWTMLRPVPGARHNSAKRRSWLQGLSNSIQSLTDSSYL